MAVVTIMAVARMVEDFIDFMGLKFKEKEEI